MKYSPALRYLNSKVYGIDLIKSKKIKKKLNFIQGDVSNQIEIDLILKKLMKY